MTALPERYASQGGGSNLADILERVLDKGVVIAGDIRIDLLDIELLTIKLRLIVASVERAEEMGIDWWRDDPSLSSQARTRAVERGDGQPELEQGRLREENDRLRARIEELESADTGAETDTAENGTADGGGRHGAQDGGRQRAAQPRKRTQARKKTQPRKEQSGD
ncbi:gas vesicle protein [Streptomyces sp. ODS28]|uniref:gas vesicle protein n=1 Tax=Streptomyces sp. ODS28 TaxID=3136688 RepID=UPI0031E78CC8